MKGITFGDYHSYDDLHLILTKKEIGSPAVKATRIEVEGADSYLDLTDFFGEPKYQNVNHKFDFSTIEKNSLSLFSTIKNTLHGKKVRIILDDDPAFFYVGRLSVSSFTSEKGIGALTIEADCEPYSQNHHYASCKRHHQYHPYQYAKAGCAGSINQCGRHPEHCLPGEHLGSWRRELHPA